MFKPKSVSYSKRYFKLDLRKMNFKYAKESCDIDLSPDYTEHLKNILNVKKNTVSMPYTNDAGELKFKEISIFDTVHNLHRGPGDGLYYSVIEVKTSERILTLYTKDSTQMQLFYNYFMKALEFINVVNYKQK
jgi:hypothetical protein